MANSHHKKIFMELIIVVKILDASNSQIEKTKKQWVTENGCNS